MKGDEQFLNILAGRGVCIAYTPLPDEPDPFACPEIRERNFPAIERIPAHGKLDPIEYGKSLTQRFGNASVCILVPGQRFDSSGNRRGRGGGWFDRFLSATPRQWLRIGVCYESQLSPAPLNKNPWDEPMDWMMIIAHASQESSAHVIQAPHYRLTASGKTDNS